MAKTEYSRILLKRSTVPNVIPTVPTGTTIDTTWLDTDLLVGEGFINVADDRMWYRTNNGIVELPLSGFSSANYYTDSAYLSGNTLLFNRTDLANAYSVDLSPLLVSLTTDTYVTGGTYSNGTLTLNRQNGSVNISGFLTGNYLPLNITTPEVVSVNDTNLTFSGDKNSILYHYINFGTSNEFDNGLLINDTYSTILSKGSLTNDEFSASASQTGGARLSYSVSATPVTSIYITKTEAKVESTIGTFNGLTYGADYSANYSNRSLVDKGYVDSTVSANTITSVPYDISFAISDETTAITSGTTKLTFFVPRAMTITNVYASLSTTGSTDSVFDINVSGTSILSTKITVESGEKHSKDATTQPVISSASITQFDEITIDIDQAGTGATGAKIYIKGTTTP
jgi:hypothetical protein